MAEGSCLPLCSGPSTANRSKEQSADKAGVLSVNQVELHPWLARKDIVDWCKQRGVVLEAYSPLVRSSSKSIIQVLRTRISFGAEPSANLSFPEGMDDPLLGPLAKKHNKTPAQILIRWGLQQGFVVLPKSVTKSRIEENTNVYDFELDKQDLETLNTGKYQPSAWGEYYSHQCSLLEISLLMNVSSLDPTTSPLSE